MRRAAECDRVDDALDRSPSAPQSPTPPTRRSRRRRPSVPGDAPALPARFHPFHGRHPSPFPRPRRRPHDKGTNRPRAPTPGTGVAPPPPQRSRPWRLGRPRHASLRAVSPPPGRSADHQSAPTQEGRLVAERAGGAGSVGSISVRERGRQCRCPLVAPPNPIASTTPWIRRRQRLSRRRRNRNAAVVEDRPSPGMPRAAHARPSLSGASPVARPVPAPSSPRPEDEQAACADARHGRRPSPSSTGSTVAALPPQACIAPSWPSPSRAGRWSRISARPRGTARCYACRRCRIRRLDLGSGEEDSDADVRPSRRRMRSRRRRP